MEGLFNLAKTLFGIDIESADGLAPVMYFNCFLLTAFILFVWQMIGYLDQVFLLRFRYGTVMLDFSGLRILQTILLRTSILIRILAHLKNVEVHG